MSTLRQLTLMAVSIAAIAILFYAISAALLDVRSPLLHALLGLGSVGLTTLLTLLLSRSVGAPLRQATTHEPLRAETARPALLPASSTETNVDALRRNGQLLADFSAEIRSPLNGIAGMTQLLAGSDLGPLQREQLQDIRVSSEVILDALTNLLEHCRLEVGELEPELATVNLDELLEDVLDKVSSSSRGTGVEIVHAGVPSQLRTVVLDPVLVRRVVTGLLDGFTRLTTADQILLLVNGTTDASGSSELEVTVRDADARVDLRRLRSVLGSTTTGSETRERGIAGSGLMLARELVPFLGGSIEVTEDEKIDGHGLIFRLPVTFPEADTAPDVPAKLQGTRVLVVDEDELGREMLARRISAWGLEARAASPGDDALTALRHPASDDERWDVVVVSEGLDDEDWDDVLSMATAGDAGDIRVVALRATQLAPPTTSRIAASVGRPVRRRPLFEALTTAVTGPPRGAEAHEVPSPSPGLRVLLAEDDLICQRVAAGLLGKLGCEVDVASTGAEAVDSWARSRYDCVFMDCQMPDMDGLAAATEIRRREEGDAGLSGERTPIIALTALALPDDQEKCLEAGMDGYVSKPVTPASLRDALERFAPATGTLTEGPSPSS
ncbi:MAG: response regulator [Acidobacteriota bacterium]